MGIVIRSQTVPGLGVKVLLVNCYLENREEKIAPYVSFIETAAHTVGLNASIRVIADAMIDDGATIPGHDGVIVSGSHRMVSLGAYFPGFMEFLRSRDVPLLGICYGHQVLARAYGARVEKDLFRHDGDEEIELQRADLLFAGFPERFAMRESHEEVVAASRELFTAFDLLAVSSEGRVEAIRHKELPLWGVQFHPERSGEMGAKLIANFLSQVRGR